MAKEYSEEQKQKRREKWRRARERKRALKETDPEKYKEWKEKNNASRRERIKRHRLENLEEYEAIQKKRAERNNKKRRERRKQEGEIKRERRENNKQWDIDNYENCIFCGRIYLKGEDWKGCCSRWHDQDIHLRISEIRELMNLVEAQHKKREWVPHGKSIDKWKCHREAAKERIERGWKKISDLGIEGMITELEKLRKRTDYKQYKECFRCEKTLEGDCPFPPEKGYQCKFWTGPPEVKVNAIELAEKEIDNIKDINYEEFLKSLKDLKYNF